MCSFMVRSNGKQFYSVDASSSNAESIGLRQRNVLPNPYYIAIQTLSLSFMLDEFSRAYLFCYSLLTKEFVISHIWRELDIFQRPSSQ